MKWAVCDDDDPVGSAAQIFSAFLDHPPSAAALINAR
jgi:hypothetical protein